MKHKSLGRRSVETPQATLLSPVFPCAFSFCSPPSETRPRPSLWQSQHRPRRQVAQSSAACPVLLFTTRAFRHCPLTQSHRRQASSSPGLVVVSSGYRAIFQTEMPLQAARYSMIASANRRDTRTQSRHDAPENHAGPAGLRACLAWMASYAPLVTAVRRVDSMDLIS